MAQILFISNRSSVIAKLAEGIAKNLGTLALLLLLLPVNLGMILMSLVVSIFSSKKDTTVATVPVEQKRILITGVKMTKASNSHFGKNVYLVLLKK